MTFSVDSIALHGYAALLSRAGSDAEQCKAYFVANVPTLSPVSDGMINPLCYEHAGVQHKVGAMLDQLVTLLTASRDEMARPRPATPSPTSPRPRSSTVPTPRLLARR